MAFFLYLAVKINKLNKNQQKYKNYVYNFYIY